MRLLRRFRIWLSQREMITLLIVLLVALGTLQACLQEAQPDITHSLGSSTHQVDVQWSTQEIFTKITGDDRGTIYAMPLARDTLLAMDIHDGTPIWNIKLPLERGGGARGLLTNQNTVFVTTSIFVDAYEITTGKLSWSTRLGDGHVSVIPQLDSDILRVYYGNSLIEIDLKTGEILATRPKDKVIWVSRNVILQTSTTGQLVALDRQSGEPLWTLDRLFYVDEGQEPLDIERIFNEMMA